MDERLRQELAAWLEFYRDLGIEDFYRRAPGAVRRHHDSLSSRRGFSSSEELSPPRPKEVVAVAANLPATEKAGVGGVPAGTTRPVVSTRPSPAGPLPQSLSLFETPPPTASRERETLEQIQEDLGDCHRCRLSEGRKTIVFGQGNPRAELVFVGEAPGADEDEQGFPFVGRAGQLLNRMIQYIGLKREDLYICNVIKCRPPGNRSPERDEIETCSPFLFRQIEAIQPRLICCLGAPAVRTILGTKEGITKIRGQFYEYGRTKVFVTFHPAYILRNAREEKTLRKDFEKIRDFLQPAP